MPRLDRNAKPSEEALTLLRQTFPKLRRGEYDPITPMFPHRGISPDEDAEADAMEREFIGDERLIRQQEHEKRAEPPK